MEALPAAAQPNEGQMDIASVPVTAKGRLQEAPWTAPPSLLGRLTFPRTQLVVAGAVALIARLDWRTVPRLARRVAAAAPFPRTRARLPRPIRQPKFDATRNYRGDSAQAILEFVFVLPIILVMLFSIVDFGIAVDRRQVLQHAVREGARYGAVQPVCAEVVDRTLQQAQELDGIVVHVTYPDVTANAGDRVKVEAEFTWPFPILGELGGALGIPSTSLSITMNPSGTARLEHSADSPEGCDGP